jgi:hypothetical protein
MDDKNTTRPIPPYRLTIPRAPLQGMVNLIQEIDQRILRGLQIFQEMGSDKKKRGADLEIQLRQVRCNVKALRNELFCLVDRLSLSGMGKPIKTRLGDETDRSSNRNAARTSSSDD